MFSLIPHSFKGYYSFFSKAVFSFLLLLCAVPSMGQAKAAKKSLPSPLSSFPPDISAIKERGKLRVAVLGVDNPPFFMVDKQGNLTGIDIDLARSVAKELGVEVEFNRKARSFDEVVDLVASRQADLALSKLSLTLPRAQKVLYSQSYVDFRKALLLNRLQIQKLKYQGKRSLEEIIADPHTTIGVLAKSSYVIFAKELFPQARIVSVPSWEELVEKVIKGELTGVLYDEFEVRKIMHYQKGSSLRLLAVLVKGENDPIHAITPWKDEQFLTWLNQYFTLHKVHFTAEKILQDYKADLEPAR